MVERICPKCKIPMNADKCVKATCQTKTIMSTTLYWCDDCKVPVFEPVCPRCGAEAKYISTDVRPVFPEERLLLALIQNKENPHCYDTASVWYSGGAYIIDGKKVKISITEINKWPLEKIKTIKESYDELIDSIDSSYFEENIAIFVEANRDRYNYIAEEAMRFVLSYKEQYEIKDMMVSFSGGKDSTVTSHIVNIALGTNQVLHVFGDTTLEFPTTLEYKKRFNKNDESKGVRVLTAKNREKNFEELCDIVGPPSRVMRWCCTVFKTGAIQKTIASAFKNKTNILSFQGIRHSESASRSNNPWIYAKWTGGELLTYIGTISLGVIAIWQNGKMEQLNQDANEMNILSKAIEYEMSKKKKREELLEILQANYNVDEILAQIVRVEENDDDKVTVLFDIQIRINSSTSAVNYEMEDDDSQECLDLKNAIVLCSEDIKRLLNKLFSNKIEKCSSDIQRLKSNVEQFVEKKNCYCKKETIRIR